MIDEPFKYADKKYDPRYNPRPHDPATLAYLDSLDFRPFTEEW